MSLGLLEGIFEVQARFDNLQSHLDHVTPILLESILSRFLQIHRGTAEQGDPVTRLIGTQYEHENEFPDGVQPVPQVHPGSAYRI